MNNKDETESDTNDDETDDNNERTEEMERRGEHFQVYIGEDYGRGNELKMKNHILSYKQVSKKC